MVRTVKKYYWLAKPGIIYGNVMTTLAGFLLASKHAINLPLLIATFFGVALVIGSACVFNNVIDQDIDHFMSRTKKRALVTGTISTTHALIYATILGIIGFGVLGVWTNWTTFFIGLIGFIDYVVIYGYAKRHSKYGTLIGSISGSTPIVAGYTAVTGRIDVTAFLLFLSMTIWQMPHFYAIAIYRLKDYKAAQIPVWPLKNGVVNTKLHIIGYTILFAISALLLTLTHSTGLTYAIVMAVIAIVWIRKGFISYKISNNIVWARGMFGYSLIVLTVFSALLACNRLLP